MEGGETRVREDRKGQSVSDRPDFNTFVCIVLSFGLVGLESTEKNRKGCLGKKKEEEKGHEERQKPR